MRMNSMKTNYARTGLVLPVLLGCLLFTLAFMYFTPQSFAIVNGTEVPEITVTPMTFPMRSRTPRANPIRFTVEIYAESNDGRIRLATGVLISPDLVVTSAHSFTNEDGALVFNSNIKVLFLENSYNRNLSIPAKSIIIHPQYISFANVNDIALIKLSTPVIDEYRNPILLPASPLNLTRGQSIYIAGLGINDLILSSKGTLREGTMSYGNLEGLDASKESVIVDEFVSGGQRPALGILRPIVDGANAPQMLHHGDSGGPAYINLPAINIPGSSFPVRATLSQEPRAILYGLNTSVNYVTCPANTNQRFIGLLEVPPSKNPTNTSERIATCVPFAAITVISNFTDWIVSTAKNMGAIPPTVENPPAAATVPAGSKTK